MAKLRPQFDEKLSRQSVQTQVMQRWLLVRSGEAYRREMKTLIKNTLSGSQKEKKAIETLSRHEFSCEDHALANLREKYRHVVVNSQQFVETVKYADKGSPARKQSPARYVCHIGGNVSCLVKNFEGKE